MGNSVYTIEEQFLKAYDDLADSLFRFCFFKVSDREIAKDLTQEAYIRAWQYLSTGKEVDNMKPFLYKIARNLVIDYYRKKKMVSLDELQEKGFDPAGNQKEKIESDSMARELLETLNQLDPLYRDVVMLRYVEDMSVKEIAEILGELENTVSVRIHRGLKKARELLNHE